MYYFLYVNDFLLRVLPILSNLLSCSHRGSPFAVLNICLVFGLWFTRGQAGLSAPTLGESLPIDMSLCCVLFFPLPSPMLALSTYLLKSMKPER